MAGSALDQLKDLMKMIDDFESNIEKTGSYDGSSYQRSQPLSQPNANLPAFMMNSNEPFSYL